MSGYTVLWAAFREPRAAEAIARRWPDVALFAAEPIETLLEPGPQPKTRLGLVMVLSGALGGLRGGSLAVGTGIWMGLEVGGLPRVPYAPIGIVTFAISALGAIAGALVTLLVKGRIFGLALAMPESTRRAMTNGAVAVMIRALPEERAALTQELLAAGAEVEVVER